MTSPPDLDEAVFEECLRLGGAIGIVNGLVRPDVVLFCSSDLELAEVKVTDPVIDLEVTEELVGTLVDIVVAMTSSSESVCFSNVGIGVLGISGAIRFGDFSLG